MPSACRFTYKWLWQQEHPTLVSFHLIKNFQKKQIFFSSTISLPCFIFHKNWGSPTTQCRKTCFTLMTQRCRSGVCNISVPSQVLLNDFGPSQKNWNNISFLHSSQKCKDIFFSLFHPRKRDIFSSYYTWYTQTNKCT